MRKKNTATSIDRFFLPESSTKQGNEGNQQIEKIKQLMNRDVFVLRFVWKSCRLMIFIPASPLPR
jgi:hypothetical protein